MNGPYPNTFYRVAVKALIRNGDGTILLVKENSDKWDLPGGGIDHGESPEDAIRRELHEELGITDGVRIGNVVTLQSFWVESKQAWLMWVVYEVSLEDNVQPIPGEDVSEIAYRDPRTFANSPDERERHLTTFAN